MNCEDSPWITRTWNHPKNRELQIRELRIRELRGLPVPTFTHKNEIIKKNWNKNTKKSSIFFRRKCYITFFWKMRDFDTTVELGFKNFFVRAILVLKVKIVLILIVIYYINHQLVIGDLVLKVKQVLILTVLNARSDCTYFNEKRSK